jgi:DNA-binding IclR family transcriptional regulator
MHIYTCGIGKTWLAKRPEEGAKAEAPAARETTTAERSDMAASEE